MAYDETEHRQKALDAARESLKGMFDAVVIIGTWQTEDGNSAAVHACDGNWYAQNGLADYFLTKRREDPKMEARSQREDEK